MGILSDSAWKTMQDALAAPFPPEAISWRVQGKNVPNTRVQVLAYLDARDIQDRLDAAVGAGNWSFDWQPVVMDAKGLLVVKGTLTICGVSKSDVGDASTFEGTKGCISDALKRCAVQWGVGRGLYNLPETWVRLDQRGNIGEQALQQLQAVLEGKPMPAEAPRQEQRPASPPARQPEQKPAQAQQGDDPPANAQQLQSLRKLYDALGREMPAGNTFTFTSAAAKLRELSGAYNDRRRSA